MSAYDLEMVDADPNARTVEAYESYAEEYARIVGTEPPAGSRTGLERLLEGLIAGAHVLEVGSGTGRDADLLESRGVRVRRTDVTEAFLQQQRARGLEVERLDVLHDDLGGPYDAVVALATLIHVEHRDLARVVAKIRAALVPDGLALLSMREGAGADEDGDWFAALWPRDELERLYVGAGLDVVWHQAHAGRGTDRWNVHLLRRTAR